MPPGAYGIVEEQIARIAQGSGGQLCFAFLLGLVLALWSANAGMKAMIDALNVIYGETEKRGFVKLNLLSLALTSAGLVFLLLAIGAVIVLPLVFSWLGIEGCRRMADRDAALARNHGGDRARTCRALPLRAEPARGAMALAERRRGGRDAALDRGIGALLARICRTSPITTRPMVRSAPASA